MVCKSALISVFFAQDMTISTLASLLEDSLSLSLEWISALKNTVGLVGKKMKFF